MPGTVAAILLATTTHAASAETVLDLSWHDCAPVLASISPAVPGPFSLYASVRGHTEPHAGYDLWLIVADARRSLPDAWQFDDQGCQGAGAIAIETGSAAVPAGCPRFLGSAERHESQFFRRAGPEFGWTPIVGVARLAVVYPGGNEEPPDPAKRYFLGHFLFDHSASVSGAGSPGVSCGGFDEPVYLFAHGSRSGWLDAGFGLHPFGAGTACVTFQDPDPRCDYAVPSRPSTWGQIKSRYAR